MVYKWYILPIGGLYATYHLLGEPETTIDLIAGLKGNQWVFISPDHKGPRLFLGRSLVGGVGLPVMRPILYKKIHSPTNPEITHVFCDFCCVRMLDILCFFVNCQKPHLHSVLIHLIVTTRICAARH